MRGGKGGSRAPVEVLVALGSNLGDRRRNLEGAVEALRGTPGVHVAAVSPWFETAAVGGPPGQGPYLNGALAAATSLTEGEFLERLQAIERAFGRHRSGVRNEPRTLDLDLLFYGDLVVSRNDLVLPHPRLEERVFVLEPLAHIAPEKLLPRSGKSVRARLEELRRRGAGSSAGADPR